MSQLVNKSIVKNYQILEEIGIGGMASVYRAVNLSSKELVAIKVIHQFLTTDDEYIKRFHREAELIANMEHPNIVRILEHGAISGMHFIVMELLEGTSLNLYLKKRKQLSLDETLNFIIPIIDALGYAHKKGIIHRDIKSSNIFITKDKRPVLLDFGIAHIDSGTKLTKAGSIFGTPEYMSPEQAKGEQVDQRSDIYSLGMVMYECLAGVLPFSGTNPITIIHKIIYERPTPLQNIREGLPDYIYQAVEKAIAYDPRDRFKNANDFYNDLLANLNVISKSSISFFKELVNYIQTDKNLKINILFFTLFSLILGIIGSIIAGLKDFAIVFVGVIPVVIGNISFFSILKIRAIEALIVLLLANIVFFMYLFLLTLIAPLRIESFFEIVLIILSVIGISLSSLTLVYSMGRRDIKSILGNLIFLLVSSFFCITLIVL